MTPERIPAEQLELLAFMSGEPIEFTATEAFLTIGPAQYVATLPVAS